MVAMFTNAPPGSSPKGSFIILSIAPSASKALTALAAPLLNSDT